jgi:hypothetical protein
VLLTEATTLVNHFLHLHLEKISRSFRPYGLPVRRGAFLCEHGPSVNNFLHSSWKDRVACFLPSGCSMRRGAFLCEPHPFVNPFLDSLQKTLASPSRAFRPGSSGEARF